MRYLINRSYIFIISCFLIACSTKVEEAEIFIRPVKYETVGYSNGKQTRSFSGTAQTDKTVQLSFRNNGIITQFDIRLGQRVRRGQLLGKLDNVQARLAYEQALTQLNAAESQMNTAKLSLNRIRSLFEKGSAALSDFEAAKNAFRTAEESFQSAKRGVDIQKEQVRFGFLYAPENGIISNVLAEKDENVGPGQTVAILDAGREMEIVIGIPEVVINSITQGMTATVDLPAIPGKIFTAKVTEVAPAIDASTATYTARLTVDEPEGEIKGGMAANVNFEWTNGEDAAQALIVPLNAVGEDSNGRFVFLIEEAGDSATVKKHPITIGAVTEDGFEVKTGLSAGQKIATAGLQTLLNGQQVLLR
ncbi:MAG: efflux RND transporter periplasmic adaptor subunit [Bacteroidota bacterium]